MKFTELNLGHCPFIESIRDPGDNSLIIDLCGSQAEQVSDEERQERVAAAQNEADRLLASADQVLKNEESIYRLSFEDYIVYQVLNESYDSGYPGPLYKTEKFRIFGDSFYLEFARRFAIFEFAEHFNEGQKPLHYGIWSSNHIVDVISCREPETITLRRNQAGIPEDERKSAPSQAFVKKN